MPAAPRDPRSTDGLTRFLDFIRERHGQRWCVTPRMTPSLRSKGYDTAISAARYKALEAEHRASIRARWADLTDVERIAVMLAEADGSEPAHRVRHAAALFGVGFRADVVAPAASSLAA